MKGVWKYEMGMPDLRLMMPAGAEILTVAEQRGAVCIWALVDTDAPREGRTFAVRGTGHEVPDGVTYIGSAHLSGGNFVFHVFEVPRP